MDKTFSVSSTLSVIVVVEVARNVLEAPPLAENGAAPSVWIRRQVPVLVLEAVQEWRNIKAEAPVEAKRLEVRRDAVVNFMIYGLK